MAAYAALVSLMHIIDQIQHHPHPPISLDKIQVESLTEKLTFLQEFLEGYCHVGYSKEPDALEMRIADAAYAAEDIIESHIVDQILAGSTSDGEKISPIDFYNYLQKVIEDMDSITKEVMTIKDKMGVQHQLPRNSIPASPLRSSSTGQSTMVGFDDALLEIMEKLIGGQLDCQIIPIVGMGGIGKTTLARNIYLKPHIKEHFDVCAWATISQEYNTREVLCEINKGSSDVSSAMSENELGEKVYKLLFGRRYLIILDDLWSNELWDEIKFFFPDCNNGSRIVVTTRMWNLDFLSSCSYSFKMKFLDEDKSWDLFCKTVFGEETCPSEQEKTGKKIVKRCKGLPLSIIVIGGLLKKGKYTQEYWEYIAENLNSVVNEEDNESCLKILHMSYNQLPIHLKPCFLYMGVFKEDSAIRVSMLIKLWVAEGFLKPINGKSLEEIAKDFFKELINRNLISVRQLGYTGNIELCRIHDLVRDLCLREARKEKFYNVTRQSGLDNPRGINTQRRVVIPQRTSQENVLDALQPMSFTRSLICNIEGVLPLLNFRLLRIFKGHCNEPSREIENKYFLENMFQLVNSRFLALKAHSDSKFPSSANLLWNLQTLIVTDELDSKNSLTTPDEIWSMPQLRHIIFKDGLYLSDPPTGYVGGRDDIILGNLQTLLRIKHFKCGEEVVKRIPNIKKLGISYDDKDVEISRCCPKNLDRLHKLESFSCCFTYEVPRPTQTDFLQNLTFPYSLRKLNFRVDGAQWGDMLEKIGSLPLLEKLKLYQGLFKEGRWETVEGQFCSLKFLKIDLCHLKYWTTESSHFPRLERLDLRKSRSLEEIPSEIGEIPTLRSIHLDYCSHSVVISAKKILEEQEELLGEVPFRVVADLSDDDDELQSLASPNFVVRI